MSTVYIMDHIWVRNCMDEFLFADFRLTYVIPNLFMKANH